MVIETTSRKTKKKDTTEKPALYARLGVKEYFLFDPTQDYLDPPLQGHRLAQGKYVQMVLDAQESLVSEELGLRLKIGRRQLLFSRLSDGKRLLAADERLARESEARRAAEARITQESAGRRTAEEPVAAEEARRAAEERVAAELAAQLRAAEAEVARCARNSGTRRRGMTGAFGRAAKHGPTQDDGLDFTTWHAPGAPSQPRGPGAPAGRTSRPPQSARGPKPSLLLRFAGWL